jgi:MSHA pilin protein MshD
MCMRPDRRSRQAGVSLVELIVFIVIVSIAAAGVLLVMNNIAGNSADPLLHKQSLSVAESLLEEIESMPMTYCEPTDPNAASATSPAACTPGMSQDVTAGPVPGSETRYNSSDPFDNVADYGGCQMNTGVANACDSTGNGGIKDILANAIAGLSGYSASVTLGQVGTGFIGGGAAAGDALMITVVVTAPDGSQVRLDGYRSRYAPNTLP